MATTVGRESMMGATGLRRIFYASDLSTSNAGYFCFLNNIILRTALSTDDASSAESAFCLPGKALVRLCAIFLLEGNRTATAVRDRNSRTVHLQHDC
ncbi:hypothetical protein ColKHC_01039 [Colletotrichum higginsianum]|nr:hypothetical protein ColKHC_01039 [Colletotrichum higginsianum]